MEHGGGLLANVKYFFFFFLKKGVFFIYLNLKLNLFAA